MSEYQGHCIEVWQGDSIKFRAYVNTYDLAAQLGKTAIENDTLQMRIKRVTYKTRVFDSFNNLKETTDAN